MLTNYNREYHQYDSESNHEEEQEVKLLRSNIVTALSEVKTSGSFATAGAIDNFVLPGLSIDSGDAIRLPLSKEDAKLIIRKSRFAQFGHGSKTVTDESIRNTWEIDGERVTFENKQWKVFLEDVVKHVTRELGISNRGTVRASLYKMLLYESGSMFKPHREEVNASRRGTCDLSTEKDKGMFGTMVIILPSEHDGGDVVLHHGRTERVLQSSGGSAYGASYLAWYADVEHEIKPVTSGYRWALTYNLIYTDQDFQPSATYFDSRVKIFAKYIQTWLSEVNQVIIYPLEHMYTDENWSLSQLKGQDYRRAMLIKQSCQSIGELQLLTANLQMRVTDYQDENDVVEEQLLLQKIVDMDGFTRSVYSSLPFDKHALFDSSLYWNRKPDSQDGGGYMGNSYMEINQFYNNRALFIVPDKLFLNVMLGGSKFSHNALTQLFAVMLDKIKASYESERTLFDKCCRYILADKSEHRNQRLGVLAVTGLRANNKALFKKAVRASRGAFEMSSYLSLGELYRFGEETSDVVKLKELFCKVGTLRMLVRSLNEFRIGHNKVHGAEARPALQQHLDEAFVYGLGRISTVTADDAACVVEFISEKGISKLRRDALMGQIFQFVGRFPSEREFTMSCVFEALSVIQSSATSQPYQKALLGKVLEPAVNFFSIRFYQQIQPEYRDTTIRHLYAYITKSASHLLPRFLLEICASATIEATDIQGAFLIETLRELLTVMDLSSADVQGFIMKLIDVHLRLVLGSLLPEDTYKRWHGKCARKETVTALKGLQCKELEKDLPLLHTKLGEVELDNLAEEWNWDIYLPGKEQIQKRKRSLRSGSKAEKTVKRQR